MSKSSEEGAAGNTSPQDTGALNGSQKDANGNIYEDRGRTKKIIRVVTVMAYVFSVSFVAILLSAYYVFLWEPPNPRLQRHPLSGEPQAEYLMDTNLLPNLNLGNLNGSDDQKSEFEEPNTRLNIMKKKITTNDQERRDFPAPISEKLLTYEDFLELNHKAVTKPDDYSSISSTAIGEASKPASTTSSSLTSLPIFLKTYSTIETSQFTEGNEASVISPLSLDLMPNKFPMPPESEKVDFSSLEMGEVSGVPKDPSIRIENDERKAESINSSFFETGEMTSVDETTSATESDTLSVTSTGDMGGTVYLRIGNYSYPKTIGTTVKNNKVTVIGKDVVTTETSTSTQQQQQISGMVNNLDDHFDVSLRNHDQSSLSEDLDNDEESTTRSEVQIYPVEIGRDINENEK